MRLFRAATRILLFILASAHATAEDTALHNLSDLFGSEYVTEAEFVVSTAVRPPVDAAWESVSLPHLLGKTGSDATRFWYRIRLPDAAPADPEALYLWRFSMNATVWLNDQFLGDGGRFTEPVARNWNRPFLFLLPAAGWRAEDNYAYIRLATYTGWGNLLPVLIGPYELLRPRYERRFFWQIRMSEATFYISLITVLIGVSLWLLDRSRTQFLFLGLSAVAWSMYSLNLFVQNIPVSAKSWWWAVHSSVDWYAVTLALFAHRLIGLKLPRVEALFLGFGVVTTGYYGLVSLETISRTASLIHTLSLTIVFYLMLLSGWQALRQRAWQLAALSLCAGILLGFGIHDFAMNALLAPALWIDEFFYLQFSAPILMVTMVGILSYSFVTGLRRVAATEARVRRERERIFADVHDDVGSKVLSLVYTAETEQQAGLAREALRDIRAIIAGGTRSGGALIEILEPLEAEARARCQQAGITLDWTGVIPAELSVDDSFQYHLQRILRELVSNAIKHAETERLDVVLEVTRQTLTLIVRDHGTGMGSASAGTGMTGIQRRCNELGGSANWRDLNPGCAAEIQLPMGAD